LINIRLLLRLPRKLRNLINQQLLKIRPRISCSHPLNSKESNIERGVLHPKQHIVKPSQTCQSLNIPLAEPLNDLLPTGQQVQKVDTPVAAAGNQPLVLLAPHGKTVDSFCAYSRDGGYAFLLILNLTPNDDHSIFITSGKLSVSNLDDVSDGSCMAFE